MNVEGAAHTKELLYNMYYQRPLKLPIKWRVFFYIPNIYKENSLIKTLTKYSILKKKTVFHPCFFSFYEGTQPI